MADLTTKFASLTLKNPVTTASGTCGYGLEYANFYDPGKLGAVIVKGIRMTRCDGNPMPRVCETAGGMINAIGLQGPGVEAFLHDEHYLPALKKHGVPVFVNIWGTRVEEYAEVASALDGDDGVAALEVNISCPNVKAGGAAFGTKKELAAEVVRAVRRATKRPVIVKLSPNVADITEFARVAEAEGADAISLINTLSAMAIDIETRKPRIANVTGGLSGPAVKPVAIRMVYQCHRAVKLPILGMGGISCGADAVEFLLAGATAVSVGTANFTDPETPVKVLAFLDEYLDRHRIKSVRELVGALEM